MITAHPVHLQFVSCSFDGEPKISQDPMETVKEQYLQDGDQNTLKMLA
jgi:hypothetical protein